MSAFLQRMAAGVLHTARAIHPSVAPVWPSWQPEPDPTGVFEPAREMATGPFLQRSEADLTALRMAQPKLVPRPVRAEPETSQFSARLDIEPEGTIRPLADFEPLVTLPHRNIPADQPLHAPSGNQVSQTGERLISGNKEAKLIEPRITPYPAESLPARAPAHFPAADHAMRPARLSATRLMQQQQPAAPPDSEPDSIEIHIGRIEVLAAPPRPAPSSAPKPVRSKGLDLGEYLRRDRRPR